jgi:hypothetical protein
MYGHTHAGVHMHRSWLWRLHSPDGKRDALAAFTVAARASRTGRPNQQVVGARLPNQCPNGNGTPFQYVSVQFER